MLLKFGEVLKGMQERKRDERGFTLIELLVVVIIIGILAAIAIPVFLNQRENAWQANVKSDVRNAVTMDTASITAGGEGILEGDYAGGETIGEDDNSFVVSDGVEITVTGTDITGTHEDLEDADTWSYSKEDGTYEGAGVFSGETE